jgi:cytochrome c oxidase assembly factor CtaG
VRRRTPAILPALAAALAALCCPAAAEAHPLSGGPVTPPQLGLIALGLAAAAAGWLLLTRAGPALRRPGAVLLVAGLVAFVAGPDLLASLPGFHGGSPAARTRIVIVTPLEGEVLVAGEVHVAARLMVASPAGWTPVARIDPRRGNVRILVDGRVIRSGALSTVVTAAPGRHLVTVEYVTPGGRPFSPPVAAARQIMVRGGVEAASADRGAASAAAAPVAQLRWSDWSWDPPVVAGLALLVAGGVWAGRRFRRRRGQALWFWSGVAALAAALVSPIDAGAASLFTIHMVQHMLLLLVAPPLLALSVPPALLGAVSRSRPAARVLRALWAPVPAAALYNGVIVFWHLPAAYDATLASPWIHALEHLSFVGAGLVFWGVIFSPAPKLVGASAGARFALVVAADLVNFLLGVALAFAATPYYAYYTRVGRLWGLGPLDDLRLGGGVMWVMGQMMYAIPVLMLLSGLLRRDAAGGPQAAAPAPQGARPPAVAPGPGR